MRHKSNKHIQQSYAPVQPFTDEYQSSLKAILSAALITITGGMQVAWITGFSSVNAGVYNTDVCIAWCLTAIGGTWLSAMISKRVPFPIILQVSAVLVLLSGTVATLCRFNMMALLATRCLNGLANGLVFGPMLGVVGESQTVGHKRDFLACIVEQGAWILGISLQFICGASWRGNNTLSADQLQSVLSAICGGVALILASSKDMKNQPRPANPGKLVYNEQHDLLEALPALLRICLLRILCALSYCSVLALRITSDGDFGLSTMPYVLCGLARLIGNCSAGSVLDSTGRKFPLLLGLVMSGCLAFGVASVSKIHIAQCLLLTYQFFAGMSFAPTSAYLSEVFLQSVKQFCIALIHIAELTVQVLFIWLVQANDIEKSSVFNSFYILGGLTIVVIVMSISFMPETKGTAQPETKGSSEHS
ncbi:uncharacterized protein LOC115622972 isoform X2 [Scaptodrosophila lebanonensis]|uniref:Uncharacterized protein LOC115622972 isoform X2 n=1 Tax=Drosophila lebanonensis TaxID=7225 RepID=A0A6J2TAC5_DROLE|nr:uncharacterized protein LOC115622972 isoform X2 [Scaptodrosophila lebanonensis]